MKILLLISLVLFSNSFAYAAPDVEMYEKKAYLTLSAFDCSLVAPDKKEAERFLTIGLNAGRDFIKFMRENNDLYLKTKTTIIWDLARKGPTPDFILGHIWADRLNGSIEYINQTFTELQIDYVKTIPTVEEWKLAKGTIYKEKNCNLISAK